MQLSKQKLTKKSFILTLFFFFVVFHSFSQQFAISGKEFYVAFGRNDTITTIKNVVTAGNVELVIRFISIFDSDVTLSFTENSALDTVVHINANVIKDIHLNAARARAAYSGYLTTPTTNKKSIRITATEPISVVAYNTTYPNLEGTLVWPVDAWGTDYYNSALSPTSGSHCSGYIFIAKENNTTVTEYRIGSPTNPPPITTTLQAGEMFHFFGSYNYQNRARVVSDKPIAFFNSSSVVNSPSAPVPRYNYTFEQLLPTNTWGTKFVLPTNENNCAYGIVTAKESNTTVNVVYSTGNTANFNLATSGAQTNILINASTATTTGLLPCYIYSNKPVSVLAVHYFSNTDQASQPGIAWLPPVQQRVRNVYISPLDPNGVHLTQRAAHYMSVVVPHATKSSTTISVNGGPVQLIESLPGFSWENSGNNIGNSGYAVGRYFFGYSYGSAYPTPIPLNTTALVDHPEGLLALSWGQGGYTSYFYTVGSTYRDLTAGFTVNKDDYIDVDGRVYCDDNNFELVVYPDTLTNFSWYLNDIEIPGSHNQDTVRLYSLPDGYYTINMITHGMDHITNFFVGGGPVIWTPQQNLGSDKRNWNNPTNWTPILIPSSCHNVYIPGNLNDYPLLTGPVECNNIYFMQGGELGRPDRLTYKRAYVQMNFDLKQFTQQKINNRDLVLKSYVTTDRLNFSAANAAVPLARERWYMLSSPLHGVTTGDLGFGGFPLTFLMKFGPIEKDNIYYPVGKWSTPFTSMIDTLGCTEGFAYYMYGYGGPYLNKPNASDNVGCLEYGLYATLNDLSFLPLTRDFSGNNYGLQKTNGIIELPFFADSTGLYAHRTQVFDGVKSTFFSINDGGGNPLDFNRLTGNQSSINREANDGNYHFIPEYYNGTKWVFQPIVHHPGDKIGGDDEFMVGNPYMSSIDAVELIRDNTATLQSQYRIWNGTTFSSYLVNLVSNTVTPSDPVGDSRYIAPLQGFFLKTQSSFPGGGSVAKFDVTKISTVRPSGAASNLRSGVVEENILRIKAENNYATSYMMIGYNENASEGFQKDENVQKLFSHLNYVPEIYALAEDIPADIRFINNKRDITVPLGIKIGVTGEIRLTFTGMDNYFKASKIELIDALENSTIDLTGKQSYTYSFNHTAKGIQNGRFSIRISNSTTALSDVSGFDDLTVYGDSKGIYVVTSSTDPVLQLCVYDLQGRKVYESFSNAKYYPMEENFGSSPLIVKVMTKNGTKAIKLNRFK